LNHNYWEKINDFELEVLFHKGDKKEVNERLTEAFLKDVDKLKSKLEDTLKLINDKKEQFLKELSTPFLDKEKLDITIVAIDKQIEELELRVKDCDRLKSLIE